MTKQRVTKKRELTLAEKVILCRKEKLLKIAEEQRIKKEKAAKEAKEAAEREIMMREAAKTSIITNIAALLEEYPTEKVITFQAYPHPLSKMTLDVQLLHSTCSYPRTPQVLEIKARELIGWLRDVGFKVVIGYYEHAKDRESPSFTLVFDL